MYTLPSNALVTYPGHAIDRFAAAPDPSMESDILFHSGYIRMPPNHPHTEEEGRFGYGNIV